MKKSLPSDIDDLLQRGFRYALSLTHNETEAEDLLQDACVRMLESNAPWHRGYLFSTIRNRYIDLYRRAKKIPMEILDLMEGKEMNHADLNSVSNEPLKADSMSLNRVLAHLREEEREALYLSVVEGYTAQEIADLKGQPRGTVLSLIYRARVKLRYLLEEDESRVSQ